MFAKLRFITLFLMLFAWVGVASATPKIQTWTSAQGSRVYFVPTEGLPLVDIRVEFDAGSARDGEQYGLATLTAGLLDTGAGEWDADTIAQRLEGVGAHLSTGASRDSAWLSLRSLTQEKLLNTALDTAREILGHPSFSEKDFEREKKNLLLGLKQREESPGDLAGIAFYEALYGSHPYAHPPEGNIPTVEKLTRENLQNFYGKFYVAKNALVVIVGDLEKSKAQVIADHLLTGLKAGESPAPLPPVQPLMAAKTLRKVFPSAQTHINSGLPGLKVGDPDYFPLYVGNHILGGSGLVSKISEEVREKRGLSYSASSYFYPSRVEGPFIMSLQTKNDQAEKALEVLNKTLRDFIDQGPMQQELDASKKNITGGFPMRMDSNQKLAAQVARIAFYGLPLDYLDTFIAKVEAVTKEDVKRAFKARINPDLLQTILVGAAASTREK